MIRNFEKLSEYLGIHSSEKIESWLDEKLKDLLSIQNRSILFEDLIIPTIVTATNLEKSNVEIWGTEKTPDYKVSKAVRASCSIPIFFQPVENRFVDGGLLSNLPAFIFSNRPETHYSRVLAYCLVADSEENKISDIRTYMGLLANVIVDGAKNIQTSLQDNIYQINISTDKIKATDFDKMNEKVIERLIKNGENAVTKFIQDEYSLLHDHHTKNNLCKTQTDTNNAIVESVENKMDYIVISGSDTKWVYELFPSILSWTLNEAKIKVYLRSNNDDAVHGDYRQRLLNTMGVDIIEKDNAIANTFIFNPNSDSNGCALIESTNKEISKFVKYSSPNDSHAITAITTTIDSSGDFKGFHFKPKIESVDENELFDNMKNVSQYASADIQFSLKKINIEDVFF